MDWGRKERGIDETAEDPTEIFSSVNPYELDALTMQREDRGGTSMVARRTKG